MKNSPSVLTLGALALAATIGTSGIAGAAEFPQALAAQQFSIAHGFAQTTLTPQRRLAASPAASVTNALLATVSGASAGRGLARQAGGQLRAAGTGWSLNVSPDGTAARFENLAVQRQRLALAKDPAFKLTPAALEASGRAVIASTLRSAIVLGPQEELVPLRTDYLIAGLQNVKTRAIVHSVLANRITFGRRLRGVGIVGGGSTVTLTFANNGALESWRYDWPRYQAASSTPQAVVGVPQIVARINTVIRARKSSARIPANARQISGRIQANVPLGKPAAALQKLECGYFDPGAAAASTSSLVQPGCVYHVVARDRDGFRQGYAGAVPAGARFTRDASWAESSILPTR